MYRLGLALMLCAAASTGCTLYLDVDHDPPPTGTPDATPNLDAGWLWPDAVTPWPDARPVTDDGGFPDAVWPWPDASVELDGGSAPICDAGVPTVIDAPLAPWFDATSDGAYP